jgi:hypothetical protein
LVDRTDSEAIHRELASGTRRRVVDRRGHANWLRETSEAAVFAQRTDLVATAENLDERPSWSVPNTGSTAPAVNETLCVEGAGAVFCRSDGMALKCRIASSLPCAATAGASTSWARAAGTAIALPITA